MAAADDQDLDELDDSTPPWERTPEESEAAWLAFTIFRDLGPARSLSAALRILNERTGKRSTKPGRAWHTWKRRHRWTARVQAYDLHNGVRTNKTDVRDAMQASPGVVREVMELAEMSAPDLTRLMVDIARGEIEAGAQQMRAILETLKLAGISPELIARTATPSKRGGGPSTTYDLSGMSTDDIIALLERLES